MKKYLLLLGIFLFTLPVFAAGDCNPSLGYCPLEALPDITNTSGNVNLSTYIPGVVQLAIAIASGLAVIRIIVGGIQYMTTDAWSGKSDAKSTITNAILGLVLAISAAGILYAINPKILNFQLNIEQLNLDKGVDNTISTGSTTDSGVKTNKSAADLQCTNNCVQFPSGIPIKAGAACSNDPCYVNGTLASRLQSLTQAMNTSDVKWQVTEAYPPTVAHIDPCHKPGDLAGTCVDTALISNQSVDNVLIFLKNIQQTMGNNFEYEDCVDGKNPLVNEPKLAAFKSHLKCETTTTKPNAHIEL